MSAIVGFLAGELLLWPVDQTLPHLFQGCRDEGAEGINTSWQESVLLLLAIS